MKFKFKMFEVPAAQHPFHIGLRMTKTVIAVFLCALIGYVREQATFFSMITAVVCMAVTTEQTLKNALNQVLGILIGGIIGVLYCFVTDWAGLPNDSLLYYTLASLLLFPVMVLTIVVRRPSVTATACCVFLAVCILQNGGTSSLISALERLLDTLIGIMIAVLINILIPKRNTPTDEESTGDQK